jgi:hypothetical protein
VSEHTGRNLSKVFDQYLTGCENSCSGICLLEIKVYNTAGLNVVEGFDMPVKVKIGSGKEEFLYPTAEWKTLKTKAEKTLSVDRNFYVESKESKQASL